MRIAVASQNFRTVTEHAGKTRRFLVFEAGLDGTVTEVERLDLPMGMAMHDFKGDGPHPLDDMMAVIAGSAGEGFERRMAERGVLAVVTDETDPFLAVSDVAEGLIDALAQASRILRGSRPCDGDRSRKPEGCDGQGGCGCRGDHDHDHDHGHDHGHGKENCDGQGGCGCSGDHDHDHGHKHGHKHGHDHGEDGCGCGGGGSCRS